MLGRKTVGLIRGDILTNGYPKQQAVWARMCGYVEQQVRSCSIAAQSCSVLLFRC